MHSSDTILIKKTIDILPILYKLSSSDDICEIFIKLTKAQFDPSFLYISCFLHKIYV